VTLHGQYLSVLTNTDNIILIVCDINVDGMMNIDDNLDFDYRVSLYYRIHVTICHSTIDNVCKTKVKHIFNNTDRIRV